MTDSGFLPYPKGFATAAIHAGQEPENWDSMCVVPPIVTSTTFKQDGPAQFKKYEYARSGNPTRDTLETCLAAIEGAKYGLCFASGLGATTTILGLFKAGDHIIMGDDLYGGTNRLMRKVGFNFGLEFSFVDCQHVNEIEKAIKPNTKLIWVETPTNPTMKIADVKAVSQVGKKHKIIVAIDNTFLTPYLQRPIELGADLSVYSLTKYMNGHSDVVMGAIMTSDKELYERLKFLQNAMGIVPAPFDCYQVNRSLKTLAVRMRQHSENGMAVAKFLQSHPKVAKVLHPGLPTHPQYDLFRSQTCGHSSVFSFYIKGGMQESERFLKALKVFTLAESLGGYESLAELPCVMTHASVPEDQRKILQIDDRLIRLSVGLEDIDSLIEDLKQALDAA